ncbi:MAG TPA: menaquinone biosynthesis protein [Bryobacteraceae bacterium]|nr:menaquinone biosynthesis protein [Bryobacteraceae bacterium]
MSDNGFLPRIGAVSYLNTVPLVWGMLHGEERNAVDLSFSIPSVCAERLEEGIIDVGLVPVAEIARQNLEIVPGVGITCLGAVRSILLFSRTPWTRVRTLAADASSRSSVQLARVILRERFGVEPDITPQVPVLNEMLSGADAALVIGDPALRLRPEELPYECLDLGAEWLALTGLPMVFAAWAGKPGIPLNALERITISSYLFGKERMDDIVEREHTSRGVTAELAERYLRHYIRFELGADELKGLEAFLELADLPRRSVAQSVV